MDLTTRYLGLPLKHPLVASASPLWFDVANIRQVEDCGAAAVVLPSIFEEQIEAEVREVERLVRAGAESTGEAHAYFPSTAAYRTGTDGYLELIRRARAAVDMPVIASLNGVTAAGWTRYAREAEEAGASAIELNVYFVPSNLSLSGAEVEGRYAAVLAAVKAAVSIPVAVKLSPYLSAAGHTVRALDAAGADGFVLFNRFYQPDIDLVELRLRRDLVLSESSEIRLPLLWIGVLAGHVRGSLAASTGVETGDDVVKYLLVGADVVMTTSALLRRGIGYIRTLRDGLAAWLDAHGIDSVSRIRGRMSRRMLPDNAAFDRANYIAVLQNERYTSGADLR